VKETRTFIRQATSVKGKTVMDFSFRRGGGGSTSGGRSDSYFNGYSYIRKLGMRNATSHGKDSGCNG